MDVLYMNTFFFFKQKTAYEMRISDWSSDVCSSDLPLTRPDLGAASPDARLYCRPVCFVDRPHELDDACLHLADTMLWFAAWNVSLRDGTGVKSAILPVPELDDWIPVLPDRLAQAATLQRAPLRTPRRPPLLAPRTPRPPTRVVSGLTLPVPSSP